ncbi:GNAT family protein [Agrobacterium sp. CFBP2214]|uniref:GNAT family N-acetyltransferase n=1 Tax=Agrobacterium sp. CFBP2214 TaxID=3040274 RepID=UPI00254B303D|nr:GNAT family protein [Agrobacterium sp. CFBP2214]
MNIVTDERVLHFVSTSIGVSFVPPFTCMGIDRDGEIVAGAIFNVFEGADVHVSIAGHGWTRGFCEAVGDYVFGQLQCERMTAKTEKAEIVRFAERLGGQVEGLLRNHFGPGRDAFLVGILRDEWRF